MERHDYPALAETLYTATLPSGLRVMVLPRKGFTKKLAYLVTDFGSVHTSFTLEGKEHTVPAGIAHYLEHKLFDMPDGRDISEEFAELGAIVNAFTSYDMTAYYFSCTERFESCLQLLLELVYTPHFTEESVLKEQGIIDQEIGMNLDAPDSVVFDELMVSLFQSHPIRVPILGTKETIRRITPQMLYDIHRAFYAPGNMWLCVTGAVDPEEVAAQADRFLGPDRREPGVKAPYPTEPDTRARETVRSPMEVAMPNFSMGIKFPFPGTGPEGIRREMAAEIATEALFGESSELYLKLYDEGLIDSSFGGGFETVDGCAMLLCSGDSNAPIAVRDAVIAQAARLAREGIPEEYFRRLLRSAMGRRIRGLDSFDSTVFRLCAYAMTDFDYLTFPEVFQKLTREDLQPIFTRAADPEHCAISIIDPITKEDNT